ncbi:DNA endonuclease RBBP8 isoform X2 [Triplophysa rosa]|uniref:DNA endonuclease RBBP8 isoform X2 n=1 Tax=Triplophysa rosa TaxID=992332 RepID=UPI002545C8CC|nr:DNA endonuclease RBBP8 isoform X2 [Triplophysa rosa]
MLSETFMNLHGKVQKCEIQKNKNRLYPNHVFIVELQAKVTKLKKERCLDAQRLREFHSKNQQLREQQRDLQEKIRQLDDRVHSGPCERCAHKTNMKFDDAEQKNRDLISKLEVERMRLREENRKMSAELERLRNSGCEAEEGMIPDSPLQPLSLPVVSKMKRRKDQNHVRYAEKPLSLSYPERMRGEMSAPSACYGTSVLVAETCEMDMTWITEPKNRKHHKTVVPETCRIDVQPEQLEDDENDTQRSVHPEPCDRTAVSSTSALRNDDSQTVLSSREQQNPSTDDTPHTPSNNSTCLPVTGKRKHTGCKKTEKKNSDSSLDEPDESGMEGKSVLWRKGRFVEINERHSETEMIQTHQDSKRKRLETHQHTSHKRRNNAAFPYDQSWSVDPGVDLHQYDSEHSPQPQLRTDLETLDTDCTFVSHSLLLRGQKVAGQAQVTGVGQKANDSLADIFDKTTYSEYESCPRDVSCDAERDVTHMEEKEEEEMGEDEEVEDEFCRPTDREQIKSNGDASDRNKSFACVEVVRKKDERRKLKGHYCKECEIYYADLPEEEREKKLSSCSRHRYRYIPPATPENFWEVGFPSTQTCVDRGYIKEEEQPDVRMRRRRPYLAMFSPKAKSQKKPS